MHLATDAAGLLAVFGCYFQLTVADFFLYEHCQRMTAFDSNLINDAEHPWLKGFMKRFEVKFS